MRPTPREPVARQAPRLGFRTSGLRGWPLVPALDLLCRCGAREVELCLEHPATPAEPWPAERVARVQGLLAERDLGCGCVSYHGKRDPEPVKTARTRALLHVAAALGARVALIAPPLAERGWTEPGFARWCGDLAADARGAGVALAVEPEPGTVVPGVAAALRLLAASDDLFVGLDLGHAFLTEGSACAALERLGPWVVHTHWDDVRGGRHVHLPPGDGEADLVAAARWLLAGGWQGAWVVDLFDLGPDPEPGVRAGIAGLGRVLAEAGA